MTRRCHVAALALLAAFAATCSRAPEAPSLLTASGRAPAYLEPRTRDYEIAPLLSVGDRVPLTSDRTRQFQMVGTPDGMGLLPNADGTATLFMNHELPPSTLSEPVVGEPLVRGAFVSRWTLGANAEVISGDLAHDTVHDAHGTAFPAAREDNATPALSKLCSAYLAGPADGFDQPVFLTNEEDPGGATFGGRGGQAFAIFDGEAHVLPGLGCFSKENSIVVPDTGEITAVVSLEDHEWGVKSQLYLHVGRKSRDAGAAPAARNGLASGELHVLRAVGSRVRAESQLREGTLDVEWARIDGAMDKSAGELEDAVVSLGALSFVRLEDGAFSPGRPRELIFVSTGGSSGAGNELGRIYSLLLSAEDVLGPARLLVVHSADDAKRASDIVSPDNLAASADWLMLCEDATDPGRQALKARGRNASTWRIPLRDGPWEQRLDMARATRIAEVASAGRDGRPVAPGDWESTGVVDASELFGPDSWLIAVQAHPPTRPPHPGLVQDGQLLLMRPRR